MNTKLMGITGVLIPILALLGFSTFFLISDPVYYENLNTVVGIATFNIEGGSQNQWLMYFNYIGLGVLISAFCLSLLSKAKKSTTNKIGIILLFFSGLSWTSLGFTEINPESESMIYKGLATLILGAFGFTLLSGDFNHLSDNKFFKWAVFSVGILIIIDRFLDIMLLFEYPESINQVSWILYFLGFGLIGFSLFNQARSSV